MLLKPIIPVFEYVLNYDYISKVLCENKEVPIMGCNGKCYLMKELAKASESEKPASSDKKHNTTEISDLFIGEIAFFNIPELKNFGSKSIPSTYSNLYKSQLAFSIFHPPAVS